MSPGSNSTSQYPVYIGIWTNWSRGRVWGATLTLGRQEADLLIAFTAFFIAFVATRVWRIICFAIHRSFSKASPQNVIYHQHQAILRNSSTPEDGIRLLAYLLWANRNSTGRYRPLSTAAVAAICTISFTIAGGFSSRISTSIGDEVLIKSMNCGQFITESTAFGNVRTDAYLADQLNNAANYAQQCYSTGSGSLLDCNRFVKKQIIGDIDRNAPCPFENVLCRSNSSNLRIDSGYLSSHDHFGINTPPDQRLLWRNVYHCAPLTTTGFTSQRNISFESASLYYHYGNSSGPTGLDDFVYAAKSLEAQYSFTLSNLSVVTYANFDLQFVFARVQDGKIDADDSGFLPIDAMIRDDADVELYFLSGNGVTFLEPSDDAWYRVAAAPNNVVVSDANQWEAVPLYFPSEPASPLGCVDQYQFCNVVSGTSKCGPLASRRDALRGVIDLFNTTYFNLAAINATTKPAALLTYFSYPSSYLSVTKVVSHLGPSSLQSQRYLDDGNQYFLETGQWQLDVARWWDISMAGRQGSFLSLAYGPSDPSVLAQHTNYTSPELKELCDSQKIRTTAFGSFSLFGLIFIFLVGGSLVITSYLLEPVSTFLYEKRSYKKYEHLEWTTNATLQLQRLVQEEAGFGTWSKCIETVPGTKPNELLGYLDITNPDHPILQSPPSNPPNSIETSSTIQGSTQTESTPSLTPVPGLTGVPSLIDIPSNTQLQATQSASSLEGGSELPRTHEPTPNAEATEAKTRPQVNDSLPLDTDVEEGGKRRRLSSC
ncbi:hypothetical protein O1611_g6506 [Lasiodiplodia mahajangana]|uniref:Uncharacterized protein n=1 Tax=Lasiodiplodia mahajangana TaxID=1108764 RepID=A0ACC2JI40_9PEZI|nr:hypothetical protein O1611_g6506 [Lasiodiplodia mahajangana]